MSVAESVIRKCGGAVAVARICGIDRTQVYRWTYPKERRGTGGVIPARHQAELLKRARERGIDLRPDDFFPAEPDQPSRPQ